LEAEKDLKKLGKELVIIDHHVYDKLDRAHDSKGKILPSSLEQFLKLFRLGGKRLKKLGFNPRLVKGVGIMDRGYVWALQKAKYTPKEIKQIIDYQHQLMATVRGGNNEKQKEKIADQAWKYKTWWKGFIIIEDNSGIGLRSRISLKIATEIKKPTPLILNEKKRGFIYVQESPYAKVLLKKFGGFTFGSDINWGYRNQRSKKKVGLSEVKQFLEKQLKTTG
ncbi:hypothetical protein ACFLZY_03520, partial [Patescibacteria group bacterium]